MDVSTPTPVETESPEVGDQTLLDRPWQTVVWNDPVNLMSYVTFVFQQYFGYSRKKAERLMLQVHHDGRSIVASGGREAMERDVQAMHEYGLWATLERSEG
jgi:ATP-dependent Clp protease adaptor protein ClpS